MNWVLKDFIGIFVAVYLDDVIIYTKGPFELHIDQINQVFQALRVYYLFEMIGIE